MRLFHLSNGLLVRHLPVNQCPRETLQPIYDFESSAPDKIRLPALWTLPFPNNVDLGGKLTVKLDPIENLIKREN
jgi:hypothetical protein